MKLDRDCYSEWGTVPAGVPQGTKLGPWLIIAMINDLEMPSADDLLKYVDDSTFYEVIKKGESSTAQIPMNEIQQWSTTNKAQVKRRSFHAPNLIQLSSTLERPWSGVMSNVELNTLFLICTLAQHEV